MSPWNYGNYYMGNTTMQMMPMMMRKVNQFSQMQGMNNVGAMPMMPMLPMMPCLPASFSLPMVAAPMMAAASPLPVTFNPLMQGMYPMGSMNASSLMTPSSFMNAFTTGPMAYRPPASFEFPSNVSMVMPMPFGTPNPLFSMSSFGGFSPQYNLNGGLSCCCCYCSPTITAPPISFYPRPVSVPQPYPVPYPAPVPIPNIQQIPVPRPVSVVAPPIIAGANQAFPVPMGAPLIPSQGGFSQSNLGQISVMASNRKQTCDTLLTDRSDDKLTGRKSVNIASDPARRLKAQRIAASLSNLGVDNAWPKQKHRTKLGKKTHDDDLISRNSSKFNSSRCVQSKDRHRSTRTSTKSVSSRHGSNTMQSSHSNRLNKPIRHCHQRTHRTLTRTTTMNDE
jgi:hypothetical protein